MFIEYNTFTPFSKKKMNAYTIGPIGIQCPVATGHCPIMKIIHSLP